MSSLGSKFEYPIICSDTECLVMLIVLYICSFFMSNDSVGMYLGEIDTIVSYNWSKDMYCDVSLFNMIFNCVIHVMVRLLDLTAN